jgi:lysozyme
VWTIGYGHTRGVRPGDTCTKEQAERWLLEDFAPVRIAVEGLPGLVWYQQAALGSLGFNTFKAITDSTLVRMIYQGRAVQAAPQFDLWCKERVNGVLRVSQGLVNRRAFERDIYEGKHKWLSE